MKDGSFPVHDANGSKFQSNVQSGIVCHGHFFHGYYGCYCYLPLYVFCGRHLLAAKLRRANIDAAAGVVEEIERIVAQIRTHWPKTRILLRAD